MKKVSKLFLPEMEFSAIAVINVLTNHDSDCFSPTFSWKNNEQQLRTRPYWNTVNANFI
jgi:hypothetical protein